MVDEGLPLNRLSVARLHTLGDPINLHIADICAIWKPPRRSKSASLAGLKSELGKENPADPHPLNPRLPRPTDSAGNPERHHQPRMNHRPHPASTSAARPGRTDPPHRPLSPPQSIRKSKTARPIYPRETRAEMSGGSGRKVRLLLPTPATSLGKEKGIHVGIADYSTMIVGGGSGGIRTHGTVPRTLVFKTRALNHSATLPTVAVRAGVQAAPPRQRRPRLACAAGQCKCLATGYGCPVDSRPMGENRKGKSAPFTAPFPPGILPPWTNSCMTGI